MLPLPVGGRRMLCVAAPRLLPLMSPRGALALGTCGFALEVLLLTPWVDDLADENATAHFTQHGMIFVGGLIMGWALRDLRLTSLFNARR
ncbi:MAG: hypothetical protein QOI71_3754 [Gaiellales bacterium]|nr:hypothetical protein [Gaiellales bacterium]